MTRVCPNRMTVCRLSARRTSAKGPIACALIAATAFGACTATESTSGAGTGGASAGSGGAASGGATGSGGAVGSGGATGSGGAVGSGGALGSGGTTGTGGRGTGTGGGAAGRAGTGGSAVGGGTGFAGAGGDSLCTPGRYIICEGFESTAPGTNVAPAGWARVGAVDVVADAANVYRGAHSMRINAAANGPRRITKTGADVTALGGSHWGRIFFKVQTPAPHPASGVVHSTLVAGNAMSPVAGDGTSEYRMVDTVEDTTGHFQFLYNVQPSQSTRQEFGNNRVPYNWTYDGQWHCAEWHIDFATQNYHFYLDGAEVPQVAVTNGAGNFTNSEIPMVFTNLEVGWNNYQVSTPGFVAWIDEIAMDTNRITCGN